MMQSAIAEAVSYASCNGIVVTSKDGLSHAPMTYRPSPLNRFCHSEAQRLSPILNLMLRSIASDTSYLRTALKETASVDPFTGRLLELLPDVIEGPEIAIVRYDYFIQPVRGTAMLRMVEMNTIASSFAALGTKVCNMHRYLGARSMKKENYPNIADLPQNDALGGLANALAEAHRAFVREHEAAIKVRGKHKRTVALMVVQPGERNSFDQDALRIELWERHSVQMLRISLRDIHYRGYVDPERKLLRIEGASDGETEVIASVVYFRAGYTPGDYPGEEEWQARQLIETSVAAKCPSIAMQLVGTKKIQQLLDEENGVERFVKCEEDARAIRQTFARQWSLAEQDRGAEAAAMAIARPDDFVLKPQREGGGNNLYADELRNELLQTGPNERAAYVLMERIKPVVTKNVFIREGKSTEVDVVSEFGVYGVYIATKGKVVLNESAGTLLRSKVATQDDGGVAAGVAVLDSPYLVD